MRYKRYVIIIGETSCNAVAIATPESDNMVIIGLGSMSNSALKEKIINLIEDDKPNQTKDEPVELKITIKDVAQRARRVSQKEQREVDKQIQRWLKDDVIKLNMFS